jgi:hypothetical protein
MVYVIKIPVKCFQFLKGGFYSSDFVNMGNHNEEKANV